MLLDRADFGEFCGLNSIPGCPLENTGAASDGRRFESAFQALGQGAVHICYYTFELVGYSYCAIGQLRAMYVGFEGKGVKDEALWVHHN